MKSPTETPIRILHLEDNEIDHVLVDEMLRENNLICDFTLAKSREEFLNALQNKAQEFDLVLSDYTIPSYSGVSTLAMARKVRPHVPFIFFSGSIGEEAAVESLTNGAMDYVLKQRPMRLASAIRRALDTSAAQKNLQQSQQKILEQASLLDKASDGILVCNTQDHILYWNKSAERIYEWSAEEVLGKDVKDILFQNTTAQFESAIAQLFERGEWVGETEHLTKSGKTILTQSRFTLIRDNEDNPKSLLIVMTDITGIKQMEEHLLRVERLESLGMLVSSIAHDLNNMLAPIHMGLGLLRTEIKEEALGSVLKTMENSAKRGTDMVKQVLTFARGGEIQKGEVSVDILLREITSAITKTFPKNIRLQIQAQHCKSILASSTQIHQVLLNLCVNARDAMPDGGELTIGARLVTLIQADIPQTSKSIPGEYICFNVKDTGTGIPEEQLQKIFQPFFTTKSAGKGTGLGLSTCVKIVNEHNGFIQIDSKLNQGTEFRFYLPTFDSTDRKTTVLPAIDLPPGNGETVLIITEEVGFTAIMRSTLESYNYKIMVAENSCQGAQFLSDASTGVSLIIVNANSEIAPSSAIVQNILNASPKIKVIGVGVGKNTNKIGELTVDAFLTQPFTADKLLLTVHSVLTPKS